MTPGYRYPRCACPECGHDVAVRLDGRLRVHSVADRWGRWVRFCPGSELPVGDE